MSEKWLKNKYIIVYTMFLSQKFEWKMSKKNDSGIVYKTIYYHLQSKNEWKINKKNEWRIVYSFIYTMILSQKLNEKSIRKMTGE